MNTILADSISKSITTNYLNQITSNEKGWCGTIALENVNSLTRSWRY